MGEEKTLYLPAGPSEGESRIVYASASIEGMDLESGRGGHEIALESGDDNSYPLQMILPKAPESEHITRGVDTVDAWEEMVRPDFYGEGPGSSYDWVLEDGEEFDYEDRDSVEGKTARDVLSPSYEEMEELRQETEERLENADSESEERRILEEAWEEAADKELECANRKF